jgi:hypothetical protein
MTTAEYSQAWSDGAARGRQFAHFAITSKDAHAAVVRKHLAGLKALRSGHSYTEWADWPGRDFLFHASGLLYAISAVWETHLGAMRRTGFNDLESAKEVCTPTWVLWFTPDRAARALAQDELERLKQPDFVRGFVDGAARAS